MERVRPDLINTLSRSSPHNTEKHTQKDLLQLLFKNYRFIKQQHHGLRLTHLGVRILKKHYDHYSYGVAEKPSHQDFVILDKKMRWPYYISRKVATFFNENDAAWFRLNGENIGSFAEFI